MRIIDTTPFGENDCFVHFEDGAVVLVDFDERMRVTDMSLSRETDEGMVVAQPETEMEPERVRAVRALVAKCRVDAGLWDIRDSIAHLRRTGGISASVARHPVRRHNT